MFALKTNQLLPPLLTKGWVIVDGENSLKAAIQCLTEFQRLWSQI